MADEASQHTPFSHTLNDLNRGAVADEATEALAAVVSAVRATGKKGSLTVTLDIEPAKKSDGQQVLVTATVKSKLPEQDRPVSFYFTTEDGELTRNLNRPDDLFTSAAPQNLKEV